MAIVAGIGGGTGSGKTTLARALAARWPDQTLLIEHDWYYRDQKTVPVEKRIFTNYDHPDALETDLLAAHLGQLMQGDPVEAPIYDFAWHTRSASKRLLTPRPLMIVEGIHVLHDPALRGLFTLKVFVDTPADLRFIRRLRRDVAERGRTMESVTQQYLDHVRPMHEQFVEPARRYADCSVSGENADQALQEVSARIAQAAQAQGIDCA